MPELDPDGALRQAVLEMMQIAGSATEKLPAERELAGQVVGIAERNYRLGLCDGMEEAAKHLLAPIERWAEQVGQESR